MNKTTIIKNAFFSFLKSFVTLLSPIITFPYASRILMPEGIGKINFANSVSISTAEIAADATSATQPDQTSLK